MTATPAAKTAPSGEAGFTLVELLIVIIMTSMFTGLIMFFTFNYWRYGFALEADLDSLTQRLNAGDYIRDQIGTSSGLIIQNSIADSHTLVSDPTAGVNFWLAKHAIPGSTAVPAANAYTPLLYFRRFSISATGTVIMNGTQPYQDEYVMYLDGTTKSLMVRTLTNPGAANNRVKTSCPPAIATSACPPDKLLVSDLASVETRYFSRSGSVINYTSIYDANSGQYIGPDYPVVEVVEFTLNVSKKDRFQKVATTKNSTIIRIALRNT